MTIAFDAVASKAATANSTTWTHTPVGTPRGILVFAHQLTAVTDVITAVTYGGVAMTRLNFVSSAGVRPTAEYAYFLSGGIPGGAQTVSVTHSASQTCAYESISYTAISDTQAVDNETLSAAGAAPRGTNLALTGKTCHVSVGLATEHYALTQFAQLAGWTATRETDHGNYCSGFYQYDTVGTPDVAWGFDASSDNTLYFTAIAVAVTEKGGGQFICFSS